jgi:gamma-glutamyl:cysteine ligase YbdK (ATP-grasp superfamily)
MGERNFYIRYRASRDYADGQAAKLAQGELVEGWAYERDYKPSEPEPPKIAMQGAVWAAHAYTIAAEDAEIIASRDKSWQAVADECRRLAQSLRENEE